MAHFTSTTFLVESESVAFRQSTMKLLRVLPLAVLIAGVSGLLFFVGFRGAGIPALLAGALGLAFFGPALLVLLWALVRPNYLVLVRRERADVRLSLRLPTSLLDGSTQTMVAAMRRAVARFERSSPVGARDDAFSPTGVLRPPCSDRADAGRAGVRTPDSQPGRIATDIAVGPDREYSRQGAEGSVGATGLSARSVLSCPRG